LIIKAVGTVNNKNIDKDNIDGLGLCIKVNWHSPYNENGIKEIQLTGDGGIQRNTTIYREYNSEIIQQINELIER
jgi:hypothetical protein